MLNHEQQYLTEYSLIEKFLKTKGKKNVWEKRDWIILNPLLNRYPNERFFSFFWKIFWKYLKISLLKLLDDDLVLPFLSIYLKWMKGKEMGKMEGKNKEKLANHNLSFLVVFLYKKTTFPKPSFLGFFSYKRFGLFKFKIIVKENCHWSFRDRFFSYHHCKNNYFDSVCSSRVYCMYIKDVCMHLLSSSCTILSKPCLHSNLLFLHSFFHSVLFFYILNSPWGLK